MYSNLFSGLMVGFLVLTIALYLLRGIGILTFIPGGIIYLSFIAAIVFLLLSKVARRQRW
ncbi:hypothetical protein [Dactylococcopsis salina]|uniref:Uncharacterized protein n=1 Tax=Dactylococcopsis salina (strain PCC 8305) TaxID=13035 RepID=K9YXB2_DACS8|nr:hypothetical protein [Dactylococcopsis salina]AFZ51559.1 hypothetical protein Dacsa_3022 [Dactylococcopsis salina PCC 8305]